MSTTYLQNLTEAQRQAVLEGIREVLVEKAFVQGFRRACHELGEEFVDIATSVYRTMLKVLGWQDLREYVSKTRCTNWDFPCGDIEFIGQMDNLAPPTEKLHAA